MKNISSKKTLFTKIVIIIIIFTVIIAIYMLGKNHNIFDIYNNVEYLQEYILSHGKNAPLVFGIIQFLQVVISPIPGNITTVVGGALFGFWTSFTISSIAIVLGSIAAFGLARAFGRPLVEMIAGKEVTSKYFDTITKNKKILFALIILLPFFPDDIICFVAGISGMTWGFFMLCMLIARPPGLLISALVGSFGFEFPIWVWGALIFLILALFFSYKKVSSYLDKRG